MTDVTYTNGNVERWFSIPENQTIELDPEVNGYPYNLTFGPYSPELGLLRVGYKGSPYVVLECGEIWRLKHVMAEGCVVCDTAEWSGPPLDCSVTTNSAPPSRNTTMDCKVLLGKPQITPTDTPAFTLMTTPTPTSTPTGGAKGLLIDRGVPTTGNTPSPTDNHYKLPFDIMPRHLTTNYPLIYTTTVSSPNSASTPEVHRAIPFDIRIWESCKISHHVVTLVYTNGDKEEQYLPLLLPDKVLYVDMKIPGLNQLKLGPFDSNNGTLKVGYEGSQYTDTQCEADNQANKITDTCVYCVSGKWDNEPVDCEHFSHWRYKKMYCQAYVVPEKTT